MHKTAAPALWPHDDTEWSVVGTDLHQGTVTDARTGINDAAVALAPPGGTTPFQAGGQTLILGMRHPDGIPYRVLPDVFVYRGGFDRLRRSLSLRREGSPALVIEMLSQDTREVDLDVAAGKGWTYAAAGVAEYLILDPIGRYVRVQGQGHHTQRVPGTGWRGCVRALGAGQAGPVGERVGLGLRLRGSEAGGLRADGRPMPGEGEVAGEARPASRHSPAHSTMPHDRVNRAAVVRAGTA